MRRHLRPEMICQILPRLKQEGYRILSFSGGEPFLYSGLEYVLDCAQELEFEVNAITNGTTVSRRLLKRLEGRLRTVAVSLDGEAELHNRIRKNPAAFKHAVKAMQLLADSDFNLGLAYSVSRASLQSMPWAVDLAHEVGAKLVQFHPFAPVGRGSDVSKSFLLSDSDRKRAYLIAQLLATSSGPYIQCDLAPASLFNSKMGPLKVSERLSDWVNPLVIDDRGDLWPFTFGLPPQFRLATLESWDATSSNACPIINNSSCVSRILKLDQKVREAARELEDEVIDWFQLLAECSRSHDSHEATRTI